MVKSKTCCDLSQSSVCSIAKRALRFQIGKNKRGEFYWHIRAANGEIIAGSPGEGYKRSGKSERVAEILREGAATMVIEPMKSSGVTVTTKRKGDKFRG